jgi:hypothetical protein
MTWVSDSRVVAIHGGILGDNVRELELMIEAGIPVPDVLESCTVGHVGATIWLVRRRAPGGYHCPRR